MMGLPICCPVVSALIPGRFASAWARDTLCSRLRRSSERASVGSGDSPAASGARVAVTVTGSTQIEVRLRVTDSVVAPRTVTSRATGANPKARTVIV